MEPHPLASLGIFFSPSEEIHQILVGLVRAYRGALINNKNVNLAKQLLLLKMNFKNFFFLVSSISLFKASHSARNRNRAYENTIRIIEQDIYEQSYESPRAPLSERSTIECLTAIFLERRLYRFGDFYIPNGWKKILNEFKWDSGLDDLYEVVERKRIASLEKIFRDDEAVDVIWSACFAAHRDAMIKSIIKEYGINLDSQEPKDFQQLKGKLIEISENMQDEVQSNIWNKAGLGAFFATYQDPGTRKKITGLLANDHYRLALSQLDMTNEKKLELLANICQHQESIKDKCSVNVLEKFTFSQLNHLYRLNKPDINIIIACTRYSLSFQSASRHKIPDTPDFMKEILNLAYLTTISRAIDKGSYEQLDGLPIPIEWLQSLDNETNGIYIWEALADLAARKNIYDIKKLAKLPEYSLTVWNKVFVDHGESMIDSIQKYPGYKDFTVDSSLNFENFKTSLTIYRKNLTTLQRIQYIEEMVPLFNTDKWSERLVQATFMTIQKADKTPPLEQEPTRENMIKLIVRWRPEISLRTWPEEMISVLFDNLLVEKNLKHVRYVSHHPFFWNDCLKFLGNERGQLDMLSNYTLKRILPKLGLRETLQSSLSEDLKYALYQKFIFLDLEASTWERILTFARDYYTLKLSYIASDLGAAYQKEFKEDFPGLRPDHYNAISSMDEFRNFETKDLVIKVVANHVSLLNAIPDKYISTDLIRDLLLSRLFDPSSFTPQEPTSFQLATIKAFINNRYDKTQVLEYLGAQETKNYQLGWKSVVNLVEEYAAKSDLSWNTHVILTCYYMDKVRNFKEYKEKLYLNKEEERPTRKQTLKDLEGWINSDFAYNIDQLEDLKRLDFSLYNLLKHQPLVVSLASQLLKNSTAKYIDREKVSNCLLEYLKEDIPKEWEIRNTAWYTKLMKSSKVNPDTLLGPLLKYQKESIFLYDYQDIHLYMLLPDDQPRHYTVFILED